MDPNLIESPEMNWTLAVKDRGCCTFVLVQGHPEYSTTSLLREVARRDLQRFLRHERQRDAVIPVGYLDLESQQLLESFAARALASTSEVDLIDDFPFDVVAERLVNTLARRESPFCNWLRMIQCRRQQSACSETVVQFWRLHL